MYNFEHMCGTPKGTKITGNKALMLLARLNPPAASLPTLLQDEITMENNNYAVYFITINKQNQPLDLFGCT